VGQQGGQPQQQPREGPLNGGVANDAGR
jgi:hypothetical protein